MSATVDLTKTLISKPSITPNDHGCQTIIAHRLAKSKFHIEHMRFGEVDNLWARFGKEAPLFVFAGHTDVVPTGPETAWQSNPFHPEIRGDFLYGRGAADMKSGLAAMIVAAENFIHQQPNFKGSIAFLITSDEEGPSVDGTQKVMAELIKRQEHIHYCVVGEASSNKEVGDQIRVGRRGSLHGDLTIRGKQGHIAYPNAQNPVHNGALALHELSQMVWDKGNKDFPPTIFQISNVRAGTGALNVTPANLHVQFNFRFSTAVTVHELQERVAAVLDKHKLTYDLHWNASALPFLTKSGKLLKATKEAIKTVTGLDTNPSTAGGTSDGRFIAPTGAEVVEIGPCNASVHQINEHVKVSDLDKLTQIYEAVLANIFLG